MVWCMKYPHSIAQTMMNLKEHPHRFVKNDRLGSEALLEKERQLSVINVNDERKKKVRLW